MIDAVSRQTPRAQSAQEEIANSLSHGLMLLAAPVAAPFLFVAANTAYPIISITRKS